MVGWTVYESINKSDQNEARAGQAKVVTFSKSLIIWIKSKTYPVRAGHD
jgi:hypothetical protein